MLKYEDYQLIREIKETNTEIYELIKKISGFCLDTLSISFHDLMNHAAYISSYCQLAELKNQPLTHTREFSRIEEGTGKLSKLLTDISLFRYSFCDSDYAECSLNDIWETALNIAAETLPSASYSILGAEAVKNSSYKFFCNPENMSHAISAIIVNAIEACDNYKAVLTLSLSEENNRLNLSISDNGCKFSDKMLTEGINPFVTEKSDHTGLGLSIAATTLYIQNGNLHLSNTENGAKVTIILSCL